MGFYLAITVILGLLVALSQRFDYAEEVRLPSGTIQHSKGSRILFLLASVLLICVAGFRYYVGTDFGAYYAHYDEYADSLLERIKTLDEPGFALIAAVCRAIIDDGAFIIFISSLVTVGLCMLNIYKYSNRLMIATLLYVFLGCWHGSFNGTRQYLATAVMFCGYPYLVNKKMLKYFGVCCLAFLCHKSALVMFLLYPAVCLRVNFKNLAILALLSWVVLNAYDWLFNVAGWILDKEMSETEYRDLGVNFIRIVVSCAPAVVFLVLVPHKERTREIEVCLSLTILHALICIMTMNSRLLQRVTLYTEVFQVLTITRLLSSLKKSTRLLAVPIIIILYALFWFYEISVRSTMIPFRWVWER